jgi:uncharacterized protein YkwD
MKPFMVIAALAGLVILGICVEPSSAATRAKKTPSKVRLTKQEVRLVNAVNEYREDKGLAPLKVDPTLMRVARDSAPHFSHCINGKWCWHRAKEAGFSGWATDDLAAGYPTPEDAVVGWSTSNGHARQMRGYFNMNGQWRNYKFNRIGVGVVGRKYCAVFGREETGEDEKAESKKKRKES